MKISELIDKAKNGKRISDEEALFLFEKGDLVSIGEGADAARMRIHPAHSNPRRSKPKLPGVIVGGSSAQHDSISLHPLQGIHQRKMRRQMNHPQLR